MPDSDAMWNFLHRVFDREREHQHQLKQLNHSLERIMAAIDQLKNVSAKEASLIALALKNLGELKALIAELNQGQSDVQAQIDAAKAAQAAEDDAALTEALTGLQASQDELASTLQKADDLQADTPAVPAIEVTPVIEGSGGVTVPA